MYKRMMLAVLPWVLAVTAGASEPAKRAAAPQQTMPAQVSADELVREALQRNPAIAAAEKMLEAGRHRIPQAKALPDPTVSLSWMGEPVPFRVMGGDPSSYRGFSAMQEFPLGGKLGLRGQLAERTSQAASWDVEAMRRRVTAEVKAAFYDYFYFTRAQEITGKNRALLAKLSKIAEARYQVGKVSQADVLRAHVELSRIDQRLTTLEQQKQTAVAKLNSLLLRPLDAPLPPPVPAVPAALEKTLNELVTLAAQNDVELQQRRVLAERGQVGVQLARKEFVPDLALGYMYQQRPGMDDMHGVTFTVNLPVFYKSKQEEMVKEARAEQAAAQLEVKNRETTLHFAVREQYLAAKAAENLLKLYSQGVVPQSSLALESSLAAYEVGSVDFLTLIANFLTVLDYETEYYRELANQQIALSRLEPLVGIELTR